MITGIKNECQYFHEDNIYVLVNAKFKTKKLVPAKAVTFV